jgi:hypothetical protein
MICEVRQVIVLDMSAKLPQRTRSVVLRQAVEYLTPVWFSQWPASLWEVAETQTKHIDIWKMSRIAKFLFYKQRFALRGLCPQFEYYGRMYFKDF